ncbi:MAG: c-type cytochrome [Alphaproteobacteria bacterium]|nr:c-type cytochrome [Alphaproteobacteria bacterium]
MAAPTRLGGFPAVLAAVLMVAAPAAATPGDADRGEEIYAARCLQCHGEDGDGLSPAEERLNPPPRDFTSGDYKFRSTAFEDFVPNDDDLMRMVRDGMNGTAMPGWGDILSEQEMWDVIAYIKTFAGLEEEQPSAQVDYGTMIESSPDSIAKGRDLFLASDRCSECHGRDGKGDAVKRLKDDNGARTWPRNLTKGWTFRTSNAPKDIFTRISVGIPSTQMPSFADPKSKKKLSIEERWHVANYVASLADSERVVRADNTVIKAAKVDGGLPSSPDDPAWTEGPPATFFLVPQIVAGERFFTPANDSITVRALYDDTAIALLVEWDDRTQSIPGDAKAEAIAEDGMGEDAVAIQFPVTVPQGMEKPYFLMGDATRPVNLWQWSSGTTDTSEGVTLADARGINDRRERDASASGLTATGSYRDGTWRVAMTRPLTTDAIGDDLQFSEGRFIPIAFFNWDGSNGETATKHTMTTWYWLLLAPAAGSRPIIAAIVVALLILGALILWARGAAKRSGS